MVSSTCIGDNTCQIEGCPSEESPIWGKCGFVDLAILARTYSHYTDALRRMRGHNLGRRLAANGLRIDTHFVNLRSILVFWCTRCIGRGGHSIQYLSALRRRPSCAESRVAGTPLRVAGTRVTQEDGSRQTCRTFFHLPEYQY